MAQGGVEKVTAIAPFRTKLSRPHAFRMTRISVPAGHGRKSPVGAAPRHLHLRPRVTRRPVARGRAEEAAGAAPWRASRPERRPGPSLPPSVRPAGRQSPRAQKGEARKTASQSPAQERSGRRPAVRVSAVQGKWAGAGRGMGGAPPPASGHGAALCVAGGPGWGGGCRVHALTNLTTSDDELWRAGGRDVGGRAGGLGVERKESSGGAERRVKRSGKGQGIDFEDRGGGGGGEGGATRGSGRSLMEIRGWDGMGWSDWARSDEGSCSELCSRTDV